MQRIMVDLPEPEGPQTTTRSFSATDRDTSRSTWSEPYHLFTRSITMIGGPLVSAIWVTTCSDKAVWLMLVSLVQRRWVRPSSRSNPRLYFDMAKQNAM